MSTRFWIWLSHFQLSTIPRYAQQERQGHLSKNLQSSDVQYILNIKGYLVPELFSLSSILKRKTTFQKPNVFSSLIWKCGEALDLLGLKKSAVFHYWTTHTMKRNSAFCEIQPWGSSMWISMQQVNYWSYILHSSNTWEKKGIKWSSASALYRLQESLWFSQVEGPV
jgi:hypothetical protein